MEESYSEYAATIIMIVAFNMNYIIVVNGCHRCKRLSKILLLKQSVLMSLNLKMRMKAEVTVIEAFYAV